jgi:hypothetical protein
MQIDQQPASIIEHSTTDTERPLSMQSSPAFVFEQFFEGRVRGWGFFEDRFGKVRSRFDVEMSGGWRNGIFVIDEKLCPVGAAAQRRVWHVTPLGRGLYEADVDDMVGPAVGSADANTVFWRYRLRLPIGQRSIVLSFDDRMYGYGADTILNVSVARKWGLVVGRLYATYWRDLLDLTPVRRRTIGK